MIPHLIVPCRSYDRWHPPCYRSSEASRSACNAPLTPEPYEDRWSPSDRLWTEVPDRSPVGCSHSHCAWYSIAPWSVRHRGWRTLGKVSRIPRLWDGLTLYYKGSQGNDPWSLTPHKTSNSVALYSSLLKIWTLRCSSVSLTSADVKRWASILTTLTWTSDDYYQSTNAQGDCYCGTTTCAHPWREVPSLL